jgi:peptidoglycan/LPS O-acetylase OafA/YrhL
METQTKKPEAGDTPPVARHGELPLSDPGKDERAAEGVPVVPAFDGYRAFAILGIVLFHVSINSGVVPRAGDSLGGQLIWGIGPQLVDVLFIVSGFVVYLPTVAQRGRFGSVPAYAIRRGARLLPAFWLSLVFMLLVMASKPGIPFPDIGNLASNFSGMHTLVQMIDPQNKIGFGFDSAIWTLTLEISFYIVLPFIAAAYFRRPFLGLAIGLAIAVLWRELFLHTGEVESWFGRDITLQRALELHYESINQFPSWAFSFASGMTAAWVYVRAHQRYDRQQLERWAVRALAPAVILFGLFVYLAGRKVIGTTFPNGILPNVLARESSVISIGYTASLAATMLALCLAPRRLQLPFAHPRVRKLGDISYGIFLIQVPILWILVLHTHLPTDGSAWALAVWLAAVLPASVLYGYLSARLVEQPIRRWARRFGRHAQATPAKGRLPAREAQL